MSDLLTSNVNHSLTTRQVADRAQVDPATVRRWVRAGQLVPSVTTPGGHHRFDPAAVDRLLTPSVVAQ